jgi:hypothetical protein
MTTAVYARRALLMALAFLLPSVLIADEVTSRAIFQQRLRLAERAVVGTVLDVQPSWRENKWGDRLIVSRARVKPAETLKGETASADLSVDVEGGTLGSVTLEVSHAPRLAAGERAVFLLKRGDQGGFVPAGGAEAVLKLTPQDTVAGTTLRLADLRAAAGAR